MLQDKYAHQLDNKIEKIATNELDQKFIEQAIQVVEETWKTRNSRLMSFLKKWA